MRAALIASVGLAILPGAGPAMTMSQIDVNGDERLSLAEIRSVHPGMTRDRFVEADTDADGRINLEELSAAQAVGLIPTDPN